LFACGRVGVALKVWLEGFSGVGMECELCLSICAGRRERHLSGTLELFKLSLLFTGELGRGRPVQCRCERA